MKYTVLVFTSQFATQVFLVQNTIQKNSGISGSILSKANFLSYDWRGSRHRSQIL